MSVALSQAYYTVDDYMNWPDDIRCELIDGVIYDMAPAPLIKHQRIVGDLCIDLGGFLRDKLKSGDGSGDCAVFVAPIDVVLSHDTVVQPDIVIVCDPDKLANGKNVQGAPDAVVEVLSKSTALKDKREKRLLYERCGVKEYVIIDPDSEYAEYYELDDESGYAQAQILGKDDELYFKCLGGFSQKLGNIFESSLQ